jgi:hypothetical protein
MRVMTEEITPERPTTRRYTKDEKDQAVRLVFELRKELGTPRAPWCGLLTSWATAPSRYGVGLPRLRSMPGMRMAYRQLSG